MLPAYTTPAADDVDLVGRGARHGRYCGWGHTAPAETPPVDEVDAICREHDLAYAAAPGLPQRCGADMRFTDRLKTWLALWERRAPAELVSRVREMRAAILAAEGRCLTGRQPPPHIEPHPAETGGFYDPERGPPCGPFREAAERDDDTETYSITADADSLAGV